MPITQPIAISNTRSNAIAIGWAVSCTIRSMSDAVIGATR